jgi:cyclopropane-fatty-acyl-phospholipid synthase
VTLITTATSVAERLPLPDSLTVLGIAGLVARTRRKLATDTATGEAAFVAAMARRPIAEFTADANAQHYEVPARFFQLALGPRRKYSCCLYARPNTTLAEAEEAALAATASHAGLEDGQEILELGCGWGSLSLWMAESYPNARITAVSNSQSQREFIMARAAEAGLRNLVVITADMNAFTTDARFDRVVSVEMFEHMSNWEALLGRVRGWLRPEGRLFLHVFSHQNRPYRFDPEDREDWIAQHFFTGGIMPSHGLIRQFGDLFRLEQDWRWSGAHYQRTALHWLENFDRNSAEIDVVLRETYGAQAGLWRRRWRLFFLATAGLFGDSAGREWGVSHYLLAPR